MIKKLLYFSILILSVNVNANCSDRLTEEEKLFSELQSNFKTTHALMIETSWVPSDYITDLLLRFNFLKDSYELDMLSIRSAQSRNDESFCKTNKNLLSLESLRLDNVSLIEQKKVINDLNESRRCQNNETDCFNDYLKKVN